MRTIVITLLAFAAGVLLTLWSPRWPSTPVAASTATPASAANTADSGDDTAAGWPADAPTPEQVLYAQAGLVRTALAKLTPRVPGTPNLYVVAFAGDGGEDVFRNEVEYIARAFPARLGPSTHVLVLENNPAPLATRPLATWSNLEGTLDGLAKVMHPDDILMLYLATHGSEDHQLLVDMDPLPLDQIDANDLAGILKEHTFDWKVVVVNACYSGGFIPPLHAPGTLVLTAARSDRSSFGCGSESELTYFGHAWLVDGLNHTDSFLAAFGIAKTEIAGWERQDKLPPSEPQMDAGGGIQAQLAAWRKGVKPGPPVPFAPAPAASSAAP
ncbi:MAG: peptidase C13 [Rhodanobacter sp.]|nr:MAG: peptidase C13 [Rhodanobacter sp.]TAM12074.1 MAG: peptidase C13 [Rhodanobacter sp.]TAM34585.1 MAG: peptidase C13 [Rhodanobacter sp.]